MNTRKPVAVLAIAAALSLSSVTWGQSDADRTAKLEKKRDKKLAEEWIERAPWVLDYDKARKQAKKGGKIIFAYFSRSYEP